MFSSIDRRPQSGPAQPVGLTAAQYHAKHSDDASRKGATGRLAGLTVAQYNAKRTADAALSKAAHAPTRAQPADWPV